jgi:hypothetical protein
MTDNTQRAIIAQTSAKIASELIVHVKPRDMDDLLDKFQDLFRNVFHEINSVVHVDEPSTVIKSGRPVPVLTQDDIKAKLGDYSTKAGSAVTSDTITSEDVGLTNPIPVKKMKRNWDDDDAPATVTIKGGEVPPAWLIRACAKEGITEVFNNSKAKEDNPARPDYCATTPGPDGRNKGFWAPKTR